MEYTIRLIGLLVALGFVLFGIDDLFWDIVSIVRKIRNGGPENLPIERLDNVPPKLLAVIVAAWHEDNVIEAVVDNMLTALQYPMSMYHVFIGVYPNDGPTIDAVRRLELKYPNVHTVVNGRPGPTCKADNLNNMIRYIRQFEAERHWRFASVTVHDSEDVVHPYELKLTNFLLEKHDALQFPVIPLQRMPEFRHVFRGMTTGTYADEFAENHYRTMGTREAMSAVVPSAGTGFVISHKILDGMDGAPLFPEDSLTEDYRLSLTLAQQGHDIHYVLEKVPRLMDSGKVRWDYVATRSFFPETFRTAARQKMRWIYGITMQSIKPSDVFKRSGMGFAGRYSLYKDAKAKASNLMVLPGYLVFIYFLLSLVLPLPVMYPQHTFAWGLCVFLTFMMVFRQTMRAVAIANFYGFKSMAVACLFPPLMPVRLVWGNIINMTATLKAWKLYFWGAGAGKKKKKVAWNKTDHTFLKPPVLRRYYRNVGDVLLEKQYLDVSTLSAALKRSRAEGRRIGDVLRSDGIVTEEQLMDAVANVQHRLFIRDLSVFPAGPVSSFDRKLLERLLVYPLLASRGRYVFAAAEGSPAEELPERLGLAPESCVFVFSTKQSVLGALLRQDRSAAAPSAGIGRMAEVGLITLEQAVLALAHQAFAPDITGYMGLREASAPMEPAVLTT